MSFLKNKTLAFSIEAEDVVLDLQSDIEIGLSNIEIQNRIRTFGKNVIEKNINKSLWLIFLNQFKSPIVWLLVFAVALSFYLGDWVDAIAILIVIVINAFIGFYMEFQAQRSMTALQKLASVPTKVLRDKIVIEINSEEIVPGDIVYIEAGDMISADGRVLKVSQLQIDESVLTGESMPVEKQTEKLSLSTVLADRTNMLYKGTFSTKGNGYMIVTATGMNTELGQIATMVSASGESDTPLEKKLRVFSEKLIWVTSVLVVLIFVAGVLSGQLFLKMIETSIALAVAAIPEGLPIVATMALANGMMKLVKYNVIVKRLSAVETLGGTNIICTDKTGTLTQNKIEVNEVITAADTDDSLKIANRIMVLCNTAELQKINGGIKEIGDPLEIGLLKFAEKHEINIQACRTKFPKLKEEAFSSDTRIMATLHQGEDNHVIYAKGATEKLLLHCNFILKKEGIIELQSEERNFWINKTNELAGSGLKIIAIAYKPEARLEEEMTANLVFVGLIGMIDPPREEVFEAIKECNAAGISVIMITGDHPATAKNIALKLGIAKKDNVNVILGKDMSDYSTLTENEKEKWLSTKVFARVNPKQKLDLVAVLQESGNIVGMTGDGVNDAPALKKADIGIAMGLRGTQVSQEAADMVLKDDSFLSIVIAVKQGRVIFENIRKFVIFLLSCNLNELIVIAVASVSQQNFQLFPLQILFINLITDVLPALALGVSEGNDEIMQKSPRKINEPIIDKRRWFEIIVYAIILSLTSLGAVLLSHLTVHRTEKWNPELYNNILFFSLMFSQLLHVFNMGTTTSFFKSEVFKNKYVWWSIVISLVIIICIYLIKPVRIILSIYEMSLSDLVISIGAGFFSLIVIQMVKKFKINKKMKYETKN
ncbi:MAG: cation-translocating P-type ATPase [Bacteroidota bacterium]|nr:cation-translocating P-type ATPase [Bacteroidota bacterium]MDP3146125.1 cation-translocating P-type ATPase [Bacteroidota bacterium]